MKPKTGVQLIASERRRQVLKEKWTAEHDANHFDGELADAAVCYARQGSVSISRDGFSFTLSRTHSWPWSPCDWKPTPKDRVRELVKAGALIAAEIDRLQRRANREEDKP